MEKVKFMLLGILGIKIVMVVVMLLIVLHMMVVYFAVFIDSIWYIKSSSSINKSIFSSNNIHGKLFM